MREKTEAAMSNLRAAVEAVPFIARPFARLVLAVLECFNNELKGVRRGD